MGMAAYGEPIYYEQIKKEFIEEMGNGAFKLKRNVHKGLVFKPKIKDDMPPEYDIASSIQALTEDVVHNVMRYAQRISKSKNLVYMGGVALNCKANSTITHMWDDVWIMPSPGDSGNALGAALAKRNEWVEWKTPFLGYNIDRPYPVKQIIAELKTTKICGVANGRAEFGPRALGHRSLLADPRGPSIKDKVNAIKKRQKFRPFAPAILEEHVHDYFDMPKGVDISPYMQFTATCKKPHLFPAIVHYDKSSRVQTVGKNDSTGFRKLLEAWYKETGCPMLLNTSLNIRGKPMVNDEKDAKDWQDEYRIKVY
jgi:carbamoyltransferase